jgi:demethylmenaquinone methyltransferase / 2-methoxy-6-polyprenyl-1,4-benzoquinol methylase
VHDRLPTEARSERAARRVFAALPHRYDRLAELLSFGQNARWRRTMVDHVVATSPTTVCDVATGTAGVAIQLAERSGAHVTGVDVSEEMLSIGARRVTAAGLDHRIDLRQASADRLPFPDDHFDALTFTYLLRYVPDPATTLRELARVVRPGGRIASLDFHVPEHPLWRTAWRGYTRLILPVGGALLGGAAWWRVGAFLGRNIDAHYASFPVAAQLDAWRAADIGDLEVTVESLGGGIVIAGTVGEGGR